MFCCSLGFDNIISLLVWKLSSSYPLFIASERDIMHFPIGIIYFLLLPLLSCHKWHFVHVRKLGFILNWRPFHLLFMRQNRIGFFILLFFFFWNGRIGNFTSEAFMFGWHCYIEFRLVSSSIRDSFFFFNSIIWCSFLMNDCHNSNFSSCCKFIIL